MSCLFKLDRTIIRKLTKKTVKCFRLSPKEPIDFEFNRDFQKMTIDLTNEEVKFQKTNKSNSNTKQSITRFSVPKEDNDFWFRDIQSEIIKKATKLKYETLREIETVYSDLKANGIGIQICNFNFRKYFYQRDEQEMLSSFKYYKISCWKDADIAMKSNLFFN